VSKNGAVSRSPVDKRLALTAAWMLGGLVVLFVLGAAPPISETGKNLIYIGIAVYGVLCLVGL
jgi:hypothetical protein